MQQQQMIPVALIGARGYVGAELVKLLDAHPQFELQLVSSRALTGQAVADVIAGVQTSLHYQRIEPDDVASHPTIEVWILALPNGLAAPWVAAIERVRSEAVILDLSSDYRFSDNWVYGLPEANRKTIAGARRIANPGCYATAAQLALLPVHGLLRGAPHVFGVSGYSGAGTTPSAKNDPEVLRDNLLPYSLVGHTHENEIRRHLGQHVYFMPHVAPHFRGITATVSMSLAEAVTREELVSRYREFYRDEPLVEVVSDPPQVRDAVGRHGATIGGVTVDPQEPRAVVVATLDNLLKGAASQAVQNMNLACGLPEFTGLMTSRSL